MANTHRFFSLMSSGLVVLGFIVLTTTLTGCATAGQEMQRSSTAPTPPPRPAPECHYDEKLTEAAYDRCVSSSCPEGQYDVNRGECVEESYFSAQARHSYRKGADSCKQGEAWQEPEDGSHSDWGKCIEACGPTLEVRWTGRETSGHGGEVFKRSDVLYGRLIARPYSIPVEKGQTLHVSWDNSAHVTVFESKSVGGTRKELHAGISGVRYTAPDDRHMFLVLKVDSPPTPPKCCEGGICVDLMARECRKTMSSIVAIKQRAKDEGRELTLTERHLLNGLGLKQDCWQYDWFDRDQGD